MNDKSDFCRGVSAVVTAINKLLQGRNLGPDEVERLTSAYELTLHSLCLVDRDDPIAEIVARKTIEIGATGVRDPTKISKLVIEQLGIGRRPLT